MLANTLSKIRSLAFNICFYGWTAFYSIAVSLLLWLPRKKLMVFLEAYFRHVHKIETYVLGLDYTVIGLENLPQEKGPFLVAMKHQSAYETMKLHLLFDDPAIILKKELLNIPFWGWIAKKMEMIAVDRSKGKTAMASMIERAKPVIDQNRPIVIFPQGTRVPVGQKKPYKYGIIKLYEAYNLPIVPVAVNSGVYWPRNAFWKKSGRVTFEILPVIKPDLPNDKALSILEDQIERACDQLV